MTCTKSTPVTNGRILFVDDEPAVLHGIERSLGSTSAPWECEFTTDPKDALTRLENGRFSVIVADMCMPGMNGAEFLARAHTIAPETVRVMLTVNSDIQTALEAVNRGHVFQFLVKPCDSTTLTQHLKIAVRQYELHQAERELIHTKLEYADKMSLIGQMAAGINHDLHNILTAVMLQSDYALLNPADATSTHEALTDIKDAAAQACELTRELKMFSHFDQHLVLQTIDVKSLVDSSFRLVRPMIHSRIKLEQSIQPGLPTILGDVGRLKQVLVNLLVNARDAIAADGEIRVTADQWSAPAPNDAKPNPFVRLTVTDNGSGMDENTRKHLFEAFFTSKGVGKGTGLGLYMARQILTQHHGSITVQSAAGTGTTFYLFLPAVEGCTTRELLTG